MAGMARYWDGTNWTEQISVAPTPPPSATSAAGLNPAGKVALVGGAAALAGSFLPWVSVITVFGNIEVSGFDAGDGKLTAAAAEAAIAVQGWPAMNPRPTSSTLPRNLRGRLSACLRPTRN